MSPRLPGSLSLGSSSQGGYTRFRDLNREPLFEGKRLALPHLDVELTERCDNSCLHCYINLPENDARAAARELSTAGWKDVISQAAQLGALSIRFTGGEPLLRPDFAELYEHARRAGLRVTLFTNARRITPALAELFVRLPPLAKIEVTVYGMHPASYEAVSRRPGSFAEARRGLDLLQAQGVPFIVKGALLPPLLSEREEFASWASSLPWMDGPPGYAVPADLRARRDSPAKNRLIHSLRPCPEEVALLGAERSGYREGMRQFCTRFMGPRGSRLFICGAGLGGAVDAYGRFQPCLMLRDPQLSCDLRQRAGNLRSDAGLGPGDLCSDADLRPGGLREALENFFPRLRRMEASNPDYLARCGRCFLGGLCEQCPARSWSEHGTLDTPVEYHCQVAHAKARHLGLLEPGEQAWQVGDWESRLRTLQTELEMR